MASFWALVIWFLLFLFDDDEDKRWVCSLHKDFDEGNHNNDNVNNLFHMRT
jgi:hypothetical protein